MSSQLGQLTGVLYSQSVFKQVSGAGRAIVTDMPEVVGGRQLTLGFTSKRTSRRHSLQRGKLVKHFHVAQNVLKQRQI